MLKVILFLIVVCYVISEVEPNKEKSINRLKAKVRVNKKQIKGLTNSVKSLTEKLTKLEDQDDSIKEKLTKLEDQDDSIKDKIEDLQSSTDDLYIPKESFETLKAELEEEKVRIDTVSKEIDDVPDLIENAIDPKIDACQKSYKTLKKAVQHERERVTYLIPKVQAVPNLIQTKIDVVQGKLTKEVASLRSEIATSGSSTEELLVLVRKFGTVQDVPKMPDYSEIGFSEDPGYTIKWFVDPPTTMFNKGSGVFTAERSGVYRVELSFEITDADEGVNFDMSKRDQTSAPEILLAIKSDSSVKSMKDHVERYIILDASWDLTFLLAKSAQIIQWELAIYYVGEKPAQ